MRRDNVGPYREGVTIREVRPDLDVDAFTALRPLLFSVAYRMLGRASEAEDLVQEAWLRYARAGGAVRDPGPGSSGW